MYDLSKELLLIGELRFSYDMTPTAQDKRAALPKPGDMWYFKKNRMFHMAFSAGIGYNFKCMKKK